MDWNNPLWDSDIVSILSKIHDDANMLVIIDACNSEGAADEKYVDTPWAATKFAPPPKAIIAADNKARLADILKGTNKKADTEGLRKRESNFLSDYTPACIDAELTNKPYAVLTSARYNQRAKMDFFSLDGNTLNMSVFTNALIREVRKDNKIHLGSLAWEIAQFTKDWGHVSTLTLRPEYLSAQFDTFTTQSKDIVFPSQAFLNIEEGLDNEKEVKEFISLMENQGISFIPVQSIRDNLADFSELSFGLMIVHQNDKILARSVLRNGTVLSEEIIN